MILEHDQFKVRYDKKKTTIAQLLKAAEKAGFPATVSKKTPLNKPPVKPGKLPDFYRKALERSRKENKPLVLDFGASWCVPCKKMDKETLAAPIVSKLLSKCIFLKIDTDKNPTLAKHYRVAGMPDLRLLTPDGKTHRKLVGFQSAKVLAEALRDVVQASSKKNNMKEQ